MWLLLLVLAAISPTDAIEQTRMAMLKQLSVATRQKIHDAGQHLDATHYEASARSAARAAFPNASPAALADFTFLIMAEAEEKAVHDLVRVRREIDNLEKEKLMIRDEMAKKRIDQSQLEHDMGAVEAAEELQQARVPGLTERRKRALAALERLFGERSGRV